MKYLEFLGGSQINTLNRGQVGYANSKRFVFSISPVKNKMETKIEDRVLRLIEDRLKHFSSFDTITAKSHIEELKLIKDFIISWQFVEENEKD